VVPLQDIGGNDWIDQTPILARCSAAALSTSLVVEKI
jgi:hypothetical protein